MSVFIPALNEAENIGRLLDDVFDQDLGGALRMEKVLVVSDGSTDRTESIVEERIAREPRLELVVNPRRTGKAECINIASRSTDSDYLVLIDGDVRLNGPDTLRVLLEDLDNDVGLVGGKPVPCEGRSGLAPMVFISGDILRDYIRHNLMGGINIYSAHGRMLAMSRRLYSGMIIPSVEQGSRVLSTDQFMYYSCISQGMRFLYRDESEVLFYLPDSFPDYLRQTVRFMYSAVNTREYFDDRRFTSEFHVPLGLKAGAMLHLLQQNPLGAFAWLAYRFTARTIYLLKRYVRKEEVAAAWEVSESTKTGVRP